MLKNSFIIIILILYIILNITGCKEEIKNQTIISTPVDKKISPLPTAILVNINFPFEMTSDYYRSHFTPHPKPTPTFIPKSILENYVFIKQWYCKNAKKEKFTPYRIAVDNLGYIYVINYPKNVCIYKFNSNGNFITEFGQEAKIKEMQYTSDIAVNSKGYIYITTDVDNDNSILKFDSSGKFIDKWMKNITSQSYIKNITPQWNYISIDKNDYIFVIGNGIVKYDSSGKLISKMDIYKNDTYPWVEGKVTIDSSDYIYVVLSKLEPDVFLSFLSIACSCIVKIDSSGKFITNWGVKGITDRCYNFNRPIYITADKNGNIFVPYNDYIWKYDSSGKLISCWGGKGNKEGKFSGARGIAVDIEGNVYVADSNNHRIQKFRLKK